MQILIGLFQLAAIESFLLTGLCKITDPVKNGVELCIVTLRKGYIGDTETEVFGNPVILL